MNHLQRKLFTNDWIISRIHSTLSFENRTPKFWRHSHVTMVCLQNCKVIVQELNQLINHFIRILFVNKWIIFQANHSQTKKIWVNYFVNDDKICMDDGTIKSWSKPVVRTRITFQYLNRSKNTLPFRSFTRDEWISFYVNDSQLQMNESLHQKKLSWSRESS